MALPLILRDLPTRDDLRVYLERLIRAGEPEVRLVSRDRALAVYGCTQTPESLLDPLPVVLVMRAFGLAEAPEAPVDTTVPARALLDRLARMGLVGARLELPDATVATAWAGVMPPTSGWEPLGVIDAASLVDAARAGIERISRALPDQPGSAVVRSVRQRVWGAEIAPGLPAAAAFAAETLGFLREETAVEFSRTLSWTRLSTGRGHTLVRRAMG
ncbi:MAG: hypothetical protein ACNYNX_08910 [Leucobacter sp.]